MKRIRKVLKFHALLFRKWITHHRVLETRNNVIYGFTKVIKYVIYLSMHLNAYFSQLLRVFEIESEYNNRFMFFFRSPLFLLDIRVL